MPAASRVLMTAERDPIEESHVSLDTLAFRRGQYIVGVVWIFIKVAEHEQIWRRLVTMTARIPHGSKQRNRYLNTLDPKDSNRGKHHWSSQINIKLGEKFVMPFFQTFVGYCW